MLCVSALKLYRVLIKSDKNGISIKGEIVRHTMLCMVLLIPMIIASFVEAYISTSLIIMYN